MSRDNVLWSAIEAASSAVLSLLSSFLVAGLIGPAELGIGAAAVSVHVLLWVGVNALFADALVQRDTVDDVVFASAFWSSTAVGGAAMLLQAGSSWALQWLLDDSRLVPMALLLSLPLPLVGAGGVVQGMLTRRRAYRRLALRTMWGQGAGTLLGISLALTGAGGWALVGQQAVISGIGALALLASGFQPPRLIWRWRAVRALLKVGLPLTASTLTLIGRYRLFAVLIGGTAGSAALGQVHVAFRLVDTARELLFTALWRLMLPVLSEYQHDVTALRLEVDRLLAASSVVTMPLSAALAALLPPLLALLLGPAWSEAGKAAEPLIGLMVVLALMFPSGVALVAVGRAHQALLANLSGLLASTAGVLVLQPADPWHAVLVWCGSQLFVTPYGLWVNSRALGVGILRPLRAGVRMLGLSVTGLALSVWLPGAIGGSVTPGREMALRLATLVAAGGCVAGAMVWRGNRMRAVRIGSVP
jgi:O-antigen/teichoic acid export membrane protein